MTAQSETVRRWYVLIVMLVVYMLSIADRYVISTVLEPIKQELNLTDSGIAFLTGTSLALFYVFFGFPLAWLIDRGSRKVILVASLVFWSIMTVASGLSRNYWQLLISRFGVGIGEAGGTPGANSLISDYFPAARRPMAMSVFALGAPIGAWLGSDVAGRIADTYGWRGAFLALGVPGILVGMLLVATVKEPHRGRFDIAAREAGASFADSLRALWRNRAAFHLVIGASVTSLWGWGLMWWLPAYMIREHGMSAGSVGEMLGPMHVFGGTAAIAVIGWYVARPSMAAPQAVPKLLAAVGFLGTVVSLTMLFRTHSIAEMNWLLWLFVPSIYLSIGPSFGLLNNLAEPRMRAMFCAFVLFTTNVTNLIVAPQAIGLLSDWIASPHAADANSLRLALLWLAPTGFWAVFHYIRCAQILGRGQGRKPAPAFK